jgi:hypothetical protein
MPKTYFSGFSSMFFCLEAFEHDIEVVNQTIDLLGFDYDIVNVDLDGWPDVFPEICCMHRWYVAPVFWRPKGIVT